MGRKLNLTNVRFQILARFGAKAEGTSFLQNVDTQIPKCTASHSSILEVEVASSSEIFVSIYITTQHYILLDSNLVIQARVGRRNGKKKDSRNLDVVSAIIVLL